ncbi:MAG: helix-turn-helix transcriptional regulator [Saprospiraceae bacterium]
MENNFGRNIKNLRKRRKITLVELAKLLKISKSSLSDYEKGYSKPGLDVLIKISNFFFIPVDDLTNSIIPEFDTIDLASNLTKIAPLKSIESLDEITQWKQKNEFNVNLLKQKNESLELQIDLMKELVQSKEAENKSLSIQLILLREKLNLPN